MNRQLIYALALASGIIPVQAAGRQTDKVKTTFQTSREWRPTIDNRGDAVMVYGVGGNPSDARRGVPFEERVRSWKIMENFHTLKTFFPFTLY